MGRFLVIVAVIGRHMPSCGSVYMTSGWHDDNRESPKVLGLMKQCGSSMVLEENSHGDIPGVASQGEKIHVEEKVVKR